ncbi:MAG: ribonuclease P protein component [Candidatus Doudnabacteria bacterium RIFCSPLOWO2_02_FULL_48_8]|uniref:Ribonuclease P protein component n=1 Tax=Candidatus Doudnabacteria bacterium RIFCSPHIGHO2_01_FULL_46_24 TaxID=1817825 RepID=A0A1F5NT60_9BACT|nr:MAG: ribonuclease P protein component [Candidatus Doudnabacteria bacterium RIFCSPHIGHO2_01_FULL_46_24]OGE95394.1 MAG: ribonuclease P protein component [Candidatus Doudnabacteria bacterium RIFCSPLOWO2_02_FULL_48_8]OGE95839.1 MAG: ribonuclease P protein component [Candidatus Doudnabacteria bacterium RIFCSPHIGHO2_12_FULL_48_11]
MKPIFLTSKADFEKFRTSKAFYSEGMKLRVAWSNQNFPRFGFIIPKKVLPKVSDRNKLKRRLRAIIRANLSRVASKDLLIFPKSGAIRKTYKQLNAEFISLLTQARLWK